MPKPPLISPEAIEMYICTLATGVQGKTLFDSESSQYKIISDTGSVIANITSIVKLLKPISVSTNTLASTLIFSKIQGDMMAGKELKVGDVITLSSHITGVIGQIILQSTVKSNSRVLTAIVITTAAASLLTEKALTSTLNTVATLIKENFVQPPFVSTPNLYLGCKGDLIAYNDICTQTPALGFSISDNQCKPDEVTDWFRLDPPEQDGDGDGA